MGAMMAWQATQKYNAGNLFDCYHLLYIPYVDAFVTRANAFHGLREVFNASQALANIENFEDFISLHAV